MADSAAPAGEDVGDSSWTLTLTHGKQTFVVPFEPQHLQRVERLKREVERCTGVASKYQRLIFRGKELREEGDASHSSKKLATKAPPVLVNNAKIMLLLNQAYHEEVARRGTAPPQAPSSTPIDTPKQTSTPTPAARVATTQPPTIDLDSLDDDEVLVQAFRGKTHYEIVAKQHDTVLSVKQRVSAILGLASPQGVRLVVKGTTPADETALNALLVSHSHSNRSRSSLKCMVLLHEQQHVVMEHEDELRQLLNELAALTVDARRVERHVARNFATREETQVRVSALADSAQRVLANLELLRTHLSPSGSSSAALARPHTSEQTVAVLTQAIADAQTLRESCDALLKRVTLL